MICTTPGGGSDRLAVIDLETTGLDPATGLVLEVGVVIVDRELRELAHSGVLLATPQARAWARRVTEGRDIGAELDTAETMHLHNGLIDHLLAEGDTSCPELAVVHTLTAAETRLCTFLDGHGILDPIPLTGSSVRALDGPFLDAHLPQLYSRFNHRTIDASALTEFARFVDVDGAHAVMAGIAGSAHRTLGDCRRSIQILAAFGQHYGILGDRATARPAAW